LTTTLAITGKSGSGKTTLVKGFCDILRERFPEKTILLIDNDLSCELAGLWGLNIRSTVYGIRSGKHAYKTGIPKGMTKQEYVEWALEDILVNIDENVDIIVSWLVASKDCLCPITDQMDDALTKLIERYDFVIFDCEYDLKYLNQLVDYPIDTTIIVTGPDLRAIHAANNIYIYSQKYAGNGQFGVVLNRAKGDCASAIEQINSFGMSILGIVEETENVAESIKNFYPRLNLPQGEG
jgi:CO dehydrogenase nickel-insertion accessory protein CooC1